MRGWFRLWLFLSILLVVGSGVAAAYFIWGIDPCYRLVSVTIADGANTQDKSLAQSIQQSVGQKAYCGSDQFSDLLTLESLAKRGAVTQVGFEWQEPNGWVFEKRDMLDIANGKEITATNIADSAARYVRKARLLLAAKLVGLLAAGCIALLAIGRGMVWVKRGFQPQPPN